MASGSTPEESHKVISQAQPARRPGRAAPSLGGFLSGGAVTGVISRGKAAILALLIGCVFIGVLTLIFPEDSFGAALLLEHSHESPFPYPFTIQNMIHLLFFVGLGELFVRARVGTWETAQLHVHYLPEDEADVLRIEDLGSIRRRVANQFDGDNGFLASLINMAVLQLQATRSIDQAVSVLQTSLGLLESKVEQRYAMVRYLAWVIPTMGFIGTVSHLGNALRLVDPDHMNIAAVTAALAVAFNTTLVALIESAILVLIQHVVQTREDAAVGLAGEYCLKNLINRLYIS
ncbi:MAG TPA: MotA/TolQ/ExbB proton channel family protein [Xanthobacteraceae bacterium]|nr:MotA/TolQ/ExbB proton channel family protein [Xanthobacteraceae bacterium]